MNETVRNGQPTVSVIMPVYNGSPYLRASLAALVPAIGTEITEVIVVDDASTDGSGALAAELGATVITAAKRCGPAGARNLGARYASADADILLFVDVDVVVHSDVFTRARRALEDASVVAVFGSYDDRPAAPGAASRYANLRHHIVHQACAGDVASFWAGCGAVRATAFHDLGGFDAELLPTSSIEDVELGARLVAAGGRVVLDAAMLGTHLKHWSLTGLWHTDIVCRALPWARLLVARRMPANELNVGPRERVAAALGCVCVASLPACAALGAVPWLPPVLFAIAALLSWRLVRALGRCGGLPLAIQGLALHQLYYLYATLTYLYCLAEFRLGLAPSAATRSTR